MLSVKTVWSALAPCSNRPRRMSDMRRSGVVSQLRSSPHRAWRTTDANRIERKTKIPACFSSELLLKGHSEGEEDLRTPCARNDHDGQRCALLTTKSRNTCTRATVFNSSG